MDWIGLDWCRGVSGWIRLTPHRSVASFLGRFDLEACEVMPNDREWIGLVSVVDADVQASMQPGIFLGTHERGSFQLFNPNF